jgi:dienelactone hydrolase
VRKLVLLCIITLALSGQVRAQQSTATAQAAPQLGVVLPHEVCAAHPDQTYALYLPSTYTPAKTWPIVYAFDPVARGNVPVELMKDAAERYGYIVVSSNNARNGPWKPQIDAAQAISDDTHTRFIIDDRRVYFAGFSGGARVASRIAQQCKCAAGVLLSGAGFSIGASPSRDVVFAVFAAVGDLDFNYAEVTQLDEKLDQSGFPHALRRFDGPHQWAPAAVVDEAFAWFRLIAMKQAREPHDDPFIAAQKDAATARTHAFEQSGDLHAAWRENLQAAAALDGLTDVSAFRQAAASLAPQKAVRDAAKREKQDFEEEDRLTSDISSALEDLRKPSADRGDTLTETEHKIINLRERAEHEKHPEKARVVRRALSGVFVEFMEAGEEVLAEKQISVAKDYFELATDADPDSQWGLRDLATARALGGDRKGTLEALRHAKEKAKDPATFTAWLQEEPAFAKFREDPQFRSLLAKP